MNSMDRRTFLALAAGCVAGATAPSLAGTDGGTSRPPNLIVIMADDIGAKELSCYGNTFHETPNLDRLAETGVQFRTCYATPICHPTRLMIMTGQYGCHNGVYNFAKRRGGPDPDDPVEEMTNHVNFAQLLKAQGYATALAGKWQLSGKPPKMIIECGYDEYCIWAYEHNLPEGVKHTGAYEGDQKPARYWHPSILENGEYLPTQPEDYGPDIHNDFVIDYIRRNKERPFLVYYPMCLTHGPHERTPDTKPLDGAKYDEPKMRYKGAVEYTDTLVGRLVSALDEMGLRENTVLFFTGDNGTGGDGKGEPTELGARVPMIVNAPGLVKTRGATDELSDLSDVLRTLCDLSGASVPKDRPIDGVSLAPFLRGETEQTRDWIFSYIGDRRILRTKRYLLEDNSPLHYGRLYDCRESRDGVGYKEITDSDDMQVLTVRRQFDALLENLPAPRLDEEGHPKDAREPRVGKRGGTEAMVEEDAADVVKATAARKRQLRRKADRDRAERRSERRRTVKVE